MIRCSDACKPSNILFALDDTSVLADFGIVRIIGTPQYTPTVSVTGTPSYMAPEQSKGKAVESSDLYSLAVVLFEMLAGRPPFSASNPSEMLLKHREEPAPSPLAFRADLPRALEPLLRTALAKDPAERFPSAAELSLALRGALAGATAQKAVPAEPHPAPGGLRGSNRA